MGVPSPYLRIAFPNEPRDYLDYLDLNLSADELLVWETQLQRFLKSLAIAHKKRLILKSPTHTSRIGTLAEMFPKARFLHIVRDPRSVYPSTMKLWRVLDEAQGLQIQRAQGEDRATEVGNGGDEHVLQLNQRGAHAGGSLIGQVRP